MKGGETKDGGNGQGILFMEVRKMHKRLKKIGLGLVAAGLCMTLLLTGAIPLCEAGPNERVVKIGHHVALTGALATIYVDATHGSVDHVRYINEQEGINGVKLEMMWEDTQGLISRSIMAHKRFRDAGAIAEIQCDVTCTETLTPAYQREEIPAMYGAGITSPMVTYPVRWVFTYTAAHGPQTVRFMEWAKANWAEERPLRIGFIIFDLAVAWDEMKGGREWAPQMGMEFVGYEVVPIWGVIDTSTEWLRMMNKKPDWVFVGAGGAALVTLARDAHRLEAQQKDIKLCSAVYGMDESHAKAIGKGAEGWYVLKPAPSPVETDLPGVKLTNEVAKKYRGFKPEEVSSHYRAGWLYISIFAEAIRLAMERVGYENLTGRAFRDAMVTIKNYDTPEMIGGMIPPITITEECPFAVASIKMYKVEGGKILPLTDWLKCPYNLPELEHET